MPRRIRDDEPFPCADLLEVRQVVVELRDSHRLLASRISDENTRREKWEEDAGYALVDHGLKLDRLATAIGTAPDPIAGTEGTGITRLLHRLANAAARQSMASIDWDPGEVTKNQTPDELVLRAKASERERNSLEAQVASLTAKLAERDRQSDRVRDDSRFAAINRTKVLIAVASSGSVGILLGALAKWLL
jgi:phage shock protein A